MNKNLIIGLVALLVVGGAGGAYMLQSKQGSQKADTSAEDSRVGEVDSSSTAVESSPASSSGFRTELNDSVLAYLHLNPRGFDPAIAQAVGFYEKLQKTKVWTKLKVDEKMEGMSAMIPTAPGAKSGAKADDSLDLAKIKDLWADLSDVSVVVSSKANPNAGHAKNGSPADFIPPILVQLAFSDPGTPAAVLELLQSEVLKGKEQQTAESYSLKRVSTNPPKYQFTFKPQDGGTVPSAGSGAGAKDGVSIAGALETSGSALRIALAVDDSSVFFTKSGEKDFASSALWKKVSAGSGDASAALGFFNTKEFANIEKRVLSASMPPEAQKNLDELVGQQFAGTGAIGFSAQFAPVSQTASCVVVDANTDLSKFYDAVLNSKKNPSADRFENLIDEKTIVAGHLRLGDVKPWLVYVRSIFAKSVGALPEADAKKTNAELDKWTQLVETHFQKLGFQDFGFVVKAPVFGPMPEIGVYMAGSPLDAASRMKAVQDLAKAILATIGTDDPTSPKPQISLDPKSQVLTMESPDGMPVSGVPIGKGAVYFSVAMMPAMGGDPSGAQNPGKQLDSQLSSGKSYLSSLKLDRHELLRDPGKSDYYSFLNLAPALDMLKPFIGMGLQSAPPDLDLQEQDVDEVLTLLKGSVLGVRSYNRKGPDVVCADSVSVVVSN